MSNTALFLGEALMSFDQPQSGQELIEFILASEWVVYWDE
jgi:hypothetical protein